MSISCYCLNKLTTLYAASFIGAKINSIQPIDNNDYAFNCYNKKILQLIISLNPGFPIILSKENANNLIMPSDAFTLSLKKYVEHGTIEEMYALSNDRIITLVINKTTPSFFKIKSKIIIELIPYRANILILDQDDTIIDAKKKTDLAAKRIVMRGIKYTFPPVNEKEDPLSLMFTKNEKENLIDCNDSSSIIEVIKQSQNFYFDGKDIVAYKYNDNFKEIDPLNSASIIEEKLESDHKGTTYHDLLKLIKSKKKSLNKKIQTLQKERITYQEHLHYNEIGNLLLTYYDQYIDGSSLLNIEEIEIKLDPRLNLYQNAERYFKLYRKAKTGLSMIDEQIKKAEDELDYWEEKESEIINSNDDDILEVMEELEQDGHLKAQRKHHHSQNLKPNIHLLKREQQPTIGIGFTAKQNEHLTFTMAHKDDHFFHIKDRHGPHVIVFDSNPDNETLLLAVEASIYFAGFRDGDVMHAIKSDVKKASPRGRVNILKYDLITIHAIRESSVNLFKKLK